MLKMKCKVLPSKENDCYGCIDWQINAGMVKDCSVCDLRNTEYELINVGTALFTGDYAMVLKDGKIRKVPLDRVYNIRHVKE